MKRLINVRISFISALAVICGIISFHEVFFGNFIPLIIFCTLLIVAVVVFACLKRKYWIFFLVALAFVAVGFFNGWRTYYTRQENVVYVQTGAFSGRVTDIGRNGGAQNVLYLENCQLDGKRLGGRVKMYVYNGEEFQTGDILSCNATVQNVYAIQDVVDTSSIRNNVRYEIVTADNLSTQNGALTLGETVRKYVYNTLSKYMPKNADVGYALLTGDRNALGEDKVDAYKSAGIIHLLVVSGLHVGFIVSVFGGALNKLRIPTLVQLAVLLVPLGFYAYICGFAPSIMRAILMSICMYLARAVYGKYDLLTSLSWATLIILLWQPLYLYDVGFQLSLTSVFGISTIFLQIDRALKRREINRFLRKFISVFALSFSCVMATLFVNAYYFESVVLVGILVNMVAIPLIFVAFVACLFSLLPWWFHYLATGADYLLEGINKIAMFVQQLNLTLPVRAVLLGIIVSTMLLFVIGGYLNLQKIAKNVTYGACAMLLVLSIVLAFVPQNCQNAVSVFMGYNDTLIVATSAKKQVAIVGNFSDKYVCYNAMQYLQNKRVQSVTLYVTDYSAANVDAIEFLCENSVTKVYILNTAGNDNVQTFFDSRQIKVEYAFPNVAVGQNIVIRPVYDASLTAVIVKVGNICVADVVSTDVKAEQFATLQYNVDYAVLSGDAETFSQNNVSTITFYQQTYPLNFGANKYGNFTIYEKDGTISLSFRRY